MKDCEHVYTVPETVSRNINHNNQMKASCEKYVMCAKARKTRVYLIS